MKYKVIVGLIVSQLGTGLVFFGRILLAKQSYNKSFMSRSSFTMMTGVSLDANQVLYSAC